MGNEICSLQYDGLVCVNVWYIIIMFVLSIIAIYLIYKLKKLAKED